MSDEKRVIVLVGESNPYGADPGFALYPLPDHASGARLKRVMGLSNGEYLRRFVRVNLLVGAKWSAPLARAAADKLCAEHDDGAIFVLLGAKVGAAFGFPFKPFTIEERCAGTFVLLPHPSGLSRAWNAPGAAEKARKTLADAGVL